jgi:DNA repair exonuclease SbcCD ATPase subunit
VLRYAVGKTPEGHVMLKVSRVFLTAALAALFLGLAACANQKQPAEQALAAIEKKFQESSAEVQKYVPERYAEVEKSIQSLRDSMAQQDYGDVVSDAAAAEDGLKRAIAEARVKRAQTMVEMETEWNNLSKEVPAMISAMDKKITSQRGRPPQGMKADEWKQTIADYDAARDSWSKAAAEISSKTFEASVLAARDAKAKISEIMEKLGVKAA